MTCERKQQLANPNIILFVVDDLGWTDLGYMGNTFNQTPNIDKIANEGTIFTDAYSNAPNCAPTRACLLSGQYSPRHGIYTVGSPERGESIYRKIIPIENTRVLDASKQTFPELLQENGYTTAHFGKWHLGDGPTGPLGQGFDFNFGGNKAGSPRSYFSPYKNKDLEDGPEGEYLTDRLAADAVGFIEENKEGPFFIYFPFYNVHTPLQGKKDLIAKYEGKQCERSKCHTTYAAMIESVDDAVVLVVDKLEELKIDQNTIIILTSDNGPYFPASTAEPLRGSKGMLYEGGIRVPMLIWHPHYNGTVSKTSTPAISLDLYPTILDMANINLPPDQLIDGKSLLPALIDMDVNREKLYWHFPAYLERYAGVDHIWRTSPAGAMRKGSWKIIEFFESGKVELYDLSTDLSESNDLAQANPQKAEEMLRELKDWREKLKAPIPKKMNPEFDLMQFEARLKQIQSEKK